MNLPRSVRVLIALAILVLGLGTLLLMLVISESVLSIQARLDTAPTWLATAWWALAGAIGLGFGLLVWRILMPRRRKPAADTDAQLPDREALERKIEDLRELGADVADVESELAELDRRRAAGEIHVAVFGEISTGKSALIRALLPGAEIVSDVRGGTTRELSRYRWRSPGGDSLLLVDMPGTAEAGGDLDRLAVDEATRAHVVVYVTDGDLNRVQHQALQTLVALRKPLILVLNKADRYSRDEAKLLADRLGKLVDEVPNSAFVQVSAATTREVVVQAPDGSEHVEQRTLVPQVGALGLALQRIVDRSPELLERLRDSATFVLASRQLDEALAASRQARADTLVDGYAVKAVVGAMAAIAPGSDLLIQGYLGTQMVRELTALYDTRLGKVDTELLLKLVQQHVARAHTLLLAVAGNALKAFPGLGTLAGGAMHAVAYGIIFRTLGRALTTALATRGELHPHHAAKLFEEKLGEDLDTSARSLAGLVYQRLREPEAAGRRNG
jgi:GTP-binding protein EngB required for normal cell division